MTILVMHFQALRVSIQRSYGSWGMDTALERRGSTSDGFGSEGKLPLLQAIERVCIWDAAEGLGCLRSSWLCSCIFHLGCSASSLPLCMQTQGACILPRWRSRFCGCPGE